MGTENRDKVGAVLVVGGGIAGIQASLDLANAGFFVYLVEKAPAIGGVMPQLDKTFPTNDCSICIISPKLVDCANHRNIDILAPAEMIGLSGSPGRFTVKVREYARYIDPKKCTACGVCAQKCPKKVKDEFNLGLGWRKAAFVRYPQAVPLKYAIDKIHCIYFDKCTCRACEKLCPSQAVDLSLTDTDREVEVGAIILAPGFRPFDPLQKPEYGYERYPNVLTSLEFERLLSATGPSGGKVKRPSDNAEPQKIAWIQCVGSRDAGIGREYCSSICCMQATKQAMLSREHDPGVAATIFFLDLRAQGKGFDRYYERAKEVHGVRYIRSMVSRVTQDPRTANLEITYVDATNGVISEEFDLVILSVGLISNPATRDLAAMCGIATNRWGFAESPPFELVGTDQPGIFACGAFQSPKDIPETVIQASAAAAAAFNLLKGARGNKIVTATYPAERDVSLEAPRIGVFVCHCGHNIASIVDVEALAEYARTLPSVVYADHFTFTCATDSLENMRQVIEAESLNRIVVAACSPRTHEPLFRENLRQAGLNKYLFRMVNIRDQDAWVHQQVPEQATAKAKDLLAMGVARAALLEPLEETPFPVTRQALVVGGGLAGMTAALAIADSGFKVNLVEKGEELGGMARRLHYTLEGHRMQPHLDNLKHEMAYHPGIQVMTGTRVLDFSGHVGKFRSTVEGPRGRQEIEYGAVVIATGGAEYRPTEYLYGQHPGVLTQLELENTLEHDPAALPAEPRVVMIQCVGCREPEHLYCSRLCCGAAVKNAIKIKELRPRAQIFVLFRDIRTFGFKELFYQRARELGVQFCRYEVDRKPEVAADGTRLQVSLFDQNLQAQLGLTADYLVLSVAVRPHPGSQEIAQVFKLPVDTDGFFLEAHMKLRPLDFAANGIFLCGLAHGPKYADEAIAQAQGAAARAMGILAQTQMLVGGAVARVIREKCARCLTCVRVCPFEVPVVGKDADAASIDPAKCLGCGLCTGECPMGAIELMHHRENQLGAEIRAACA
ncbi:MAG: FAD-dependent oxidoreductase [Syntrophales bacterium]|nr:FAD-dependent oxidoreductase [Syntrophales bacterium]